MDSEEFESDHVPAWLHRKWAPRCLSITILAFYLLLAVPAGCYGASQFFNHLDFANFKPDPGSILYQTDIFRSWGDNQGLFWMAPMYITLQSEPRGTSVVEVSEG